MRVELGVVRADKNNVLVAARITVEKGRDVARSELEAAHEQVGTVQVEVTREEVDRLNREVTRLRVGSDNDQQGGGGGDLTDAANL